MMIGFFFRCRGLALGGVARVGQVLLLQPFPSLARAVLLLASRSHCPPARSRWRWQNAGKTLKDHVP
jgi:hypothetical protein